MALSRINFNSFLFRKIQRLSCIKLAPISTSKKSKDTLAIPDHVFPKQPPPPPKTVEDFADTKNPRSWVSYGYDEENYEEDRHTHKIANFTMLVIIVCGCTFAIAYAPDLRDRDWAYREAFLEMNRRQKLGLPLIDRNLIPPENIDLPSDEELGDTEIII